MDTIHGSYTGNTEAGELGVSSPLEELTMGALSSSVNQLIKSGFESRDYSILQTVNDGGQAKIRILQDEEGNQWFGKAYPLIDIMRGECHVPDRNDLARYDREAEVLEQLDHNGVVKHREHFEYEGFFFTVYQKVEGRSIAEQLKEKTTFPVEETEEVLSQLLERLDYIHSPGQHRHFPYAVVHGDIKPASLVRGEDGNIVLTDFGMLHVENKNMTTTGVPKGTMKYMAREQFGGDRYPASDVYGAAVTALEMLTGDVDPELQGWKIRDTPFKIDYEKLEIPKHLAELLEDMLQEDYRTRPSAREALQRLENPDSCDAEKVQQPAVADTKQAPATQNKKRRNLLFPLFGVGLSLTLLFSGGGLATFNYAKKQIEPLPAYQNVQRISEAHNSITEAIGELSYLSKKSNGITETHYPNAATAKAILLGTSESIASITDDSCTLDEQLMDIYSLLPDEDELRVARTRSTKRVDVFSKEKESLSAIQQELKPYSASFYQQIPERLRNLQRYSLTSQVAAILIGLLTMVSFGLYSILGKREQ